MLVFVCELTNALTPPNLTVAPAKLVPAITTCVAAGPERGVTDATVGAGFADGAGVVEPGAYCLRQVQASRIPFQLYLSASELPAD